MNKEKGFSIIELMIVVIVGSFIWLALLKGYASYLEQKAQDDTIEAIERVEAGLAAFFRENDRYPCPADPTLDPEDANYGLEASNCGATMDSSAEMPWFPHPIYSERDADGDGDDNNDEILIGAVPFRTIEPCIDDPSLFCNPLPLEEAYTKDAWGNKLTYAVTKDLVDSGTFNNNIGAITLEDEYKQSIVEPADSVHYVLISHGPNKYGAFNSEGNQIQSECTPSLYTGPPLPPLPPSPFWNERENCDHQDGIFVSALKNTGDNEPFDDLVKFSKSTISALWQSIGNGQLINKNDGFVGIGDFDAGDPPTSMLHIRGDIQALDVYADSICDEAGGSCFVPEFLGGPEDDTYGGNGATDPTDFQNTCSGPNEAIIKISENHVTCANVYTLGIIPGACPVGQVMVGYSNLTGIICGSL